MNNGDEGVLNIAAIELLAEIENCADTDDSFKDNLSTNTLEGFVNKSSRQTVYQILQDNSDNQDIVSILGPHSPISKEVFFRMREMCGGIDKIGFEGEQKAEISAFLTIISNLTGNVPPMITNLSTTSLVKDEPKMYSVSAEVGTWIENLQSDRLLMIWNTIPSSYTNELETAVKRSTEASLIFTESMLETLEKAPTDPQPGQIAQQSTREWLNSTAESNILNVYSSEECTDFCLFLSDDYVIVGYFVREQSSQGAFLRTADPAFYEWALKVFQDYQKRAHSVQVPIKSLSLEGN